MSNRRPWPSLVVLCLVAATGACVQSPAGDSAQASADTGSEASAPLMTVNQLMHGILFPLGNTVFYAQADDPAALPRDAQPSTATNPLTGLYGGWQAVENSALALAESAELLRVPGAAIPGVLAPTISKRAWQRMRPSARKIRTRSCWRAAISRKHVWRATACTGARYRRGTRPSVASPALHETANLGA